MPIGGFMKNKKRIVLLFLVALVGAAPMKAQEIVWHNTNHQIERHFDRHGFPVYILLIHRDSQRSVYFLYHGPNISFFIASNRYDRMQEFSSGFLFSEYIFELDIYRGNNIHTITAIFRRSHPLIVERLIDALFLGEQYTTFYEVGGINFLYDIVNEIVALRIVTSEGSQIINIIRTESIEAIREIIRMTGGALM